MGSKINKVTWNSKENKANENILRFNHFNSYSKPWYTWFELDNTFIVFTSLENINTIIYSYIYLSIISYNLNDNKIINEIKNVHKKDVSNFRHYLDKNNKRDLIISISALDNNLKLWNYNNFGCLINLEQIYLEGLLNSAYFLNNEKQIYILNDYKATKYKIKVFNINGKTIKEINYSEKDIYFIDSYYDKVKGKNFIITPDESYFYEKTKHIEYHEPNEFYRKFAPKKYVNALIFIDDK